MLSRRDMVGKLAAGTAAVCVVGVARAGLASARPQTTAPDGADLASSPGADAASVSPQGRIDVVLDGGPPMTLSAEQPWELLHPLAQGSAVANGWSVAALTGAVNGSCVLTLQNERGRSQRVHLCRNDGRPQGLVYTNQFDLVVMNGGEGDQPTNEGFAQAVAKVAHVLAANERDPEQKTVMTALLAHNERVERFSGSEDRRLR
ncbi:MAG: hypothetical protein ABI629_02865 [bacterium]